MMCHLFTLTTVLNTFLPSPTYLGQRFLEPHQQNSQQQRRRLALLLLQSAEVVTLWWSAEAVTSPTWSDAGLSADAHICPSQGKGSGLGKGRACKPLADSVSVIHGGYKNREEFSIRGWLNEPEYITKYGSKKNRLNGSHFILISFSVNPFSIV